MSEGGYPTPQYLEPREGAGTQPPVDMEPRIQWDTVCKQAVYILLECFLVNNIINRY